MTAALAAALAVAVVAVVGLLVLAQHLNRDLGEQRRRADELAADLSEARTASSESSRRAEKAENEAAEAIGKVDEALGSVADAERRANDAEQQARRYEQALDARRGDDFLSRPMWELERVRVEREWADLAGPGALLPVEWQPTVGAVVAIELEMIKEVIGTPANLEVDSASLEVDSSGNAPSGSASALAARLGAELVRKLARSGEEMTVAIGASELTVTQPEGSAPPDLARLMDRGLVGGRRAPTHGRGRGPSQSASAIPERSAMGESRHDAEIAHISEFFGPRTAGWETRFPDDGPAYDAAVAALGPAPGRDRPRRGLRYRSGAALPPPSGGTRRDGARNRRHPRDAARGRGARASLGRRPAARPCGSPPDPGPPRWTWFSVPGSYRTCPTHSPGSRSWPG